MAQKIWDNVTVPVGVIQIVKNIEESPDDYTELARDMNSNGYIVCCTDDEAAAIDDAVKIQQKTVTKLRKKYLLPVFLIGHKYGAIVAQEVIKYCDDCVGGVCVSCTRYPTTRSVLGLAAIMAWIGAKLRGKNARPLILNAWDGCAQPRMSYGFYYTLFKKLIQHSSGHAVKKPLLIIGNGLDVSKINGKLAQTMYNTYNVHDLNNLTLIVYPDVKNNLMQSEIYSDVRNDILEFLRHRNVQQ